MIKRHFDIIEVIHSNQIIPKTTLSFSILTSSNAMIK